LSIPSCSQVARASGSCLFVKDFSCSSGFAWKGEGEKEETNQEEEELRLVRARMQGTFALQE
jgi:hypothetical protein